MPKSVTSKLKSFFFEYKVALLFATVSLLAFYFSEMSTPMLFNELFTRFGRNTFIVLSLLIPVIAGLGLNFGIVLGAMAGQIAIFLVILWGGANLPGLLGIFVLATPLAMLFGFLVGKLFNSMKGSEMVAGMVTALFAEGFYQFFFLYVMGGIIPINNERMMGPTGVGVLNAINMGASPNYLRQALDNVPMLNILDFAFWFMLLFMVMLIVRRLVKKEKIQLMGETGFIKPFIAFVILALLYAASFIIMPFHYFLYQDRLNGLAAADIVLGASALFMVGRIAFSKIIEKKQGRPTRDLINLALIIALYVFTLWAPISAGLNNVSIPVLTYLIIAGLCIFINWFTKTRLGQNIRTVGHNRNVATAAGINVDRTRIIAMMLSTVFGAYGQIIALQNFGVMNTYGSHANVGLYAIAALLVGGATVSKASVKHAIIGVLLFHSLFILAPLAANNLMGSALIGEYFRVFAANAVIALALIMHAWKRKPKKSILKNDKSSAAHVGAVVADA